MSAAEETLPHGVLGERLGPTLLNQALHDLMLGVHGAKDSPAGHLTVGGLGPVTAVETWEGRRGGQGRAVEGRGGQGRVGQSYCWEQEKSSNDTLTVQGAAYGVGLCEVADAGEQLSAVTLAVLFDGVDLGHGGRGVCPEDGLAVLSARGVASCIAAACGTH